MRNPDGQTSVQEYQQITHTHVDAWSSETRVEDCERNPGCRETTAGSDVTGTTERQVVKERLGVDLGREHFEDGGEGEEVFCQANNGLAGSSFDQLCKILNTSYMKAQAENLPCKNSGRKAMKKTRKMDTMQRLIQSKTGVRI